VGQQRQQQVHPSCQLLVLLVRLCLVLQPCRLAAWVGSQPHHLSSRCCCLLLGQRAWPADGNSTGQHCRAQAAQRSDAGRA
jgi:hypothetical protein